MTFTTMISVALTFDGQMTRSNSEMPSVAAFNGVRVSYPSGTEKNLAARLLRKLADELEGVNVE